MAGGIEALIRRDRAVLAAGLALLVALAAAYTVSGAGMGMPAAELSGLPVAEAGGRAMTPAMTPAMWTPGYAALVFLMWWVMMIAMMVPAAAPVILLHAAVRRKAAPDAGAPALSAVFLGGYLAVWAGFSALATGLQWVLELRGLVAPGSLALAGGVLVGAVLVAAGLYQFTGLKHACLAHCRSPAHWLAAHHRPGASGVFRMGLEHGAYCLGCCWALMALLFAGGIMNLYWIAGLAGLVLVEKLMPHGPWVARTAGAVLVLAGMAMLASAA